MSRIGYRADIDGLRAIAVLAVVFHHFRVPGFAGGYVGVDVFFVISGYLITTILLEPGAVLGDFYRRRIRRIFPALFVMLAAVALLSVVLLLPQDLQQFGKSLTATALFASNLDFWRGAGYFDAGSEVKPLLHTWSLAVEEQFYIAFPLLMVALRTASRRTIALILGLIGAASLTYSLWAVEARPNSAFFLPMSRAWELLAGALLALWSPLSARRPILNIVLTGSGLALIVGSVLLLRPETPFPGLWAVPACLGTSLLIWAGRDPCSPSVHLLAAKPLVLVGLISYSLYLWHWPVLVLGLYYSLGSDSLYVRALLVAVSFGLAIFSWKYVEQPVRSGALDPWLLPLAAAAIASAAAVGVFLFLLDGLPARFSPEVQTLLRPTMSRTPVVACPGARGPGARRSITCRLGPPGGSPTFIVWGDSHAMTLAPIFAEIAGATKRSGLLAGQAGCAPLIGAERRGENCGTFNAAQLETALGPDIRDVVLVARWGINAEGRRYGTEAGKRLLLSDALGHDSADNHRVFSVALERTVRRLRAAGKRVIRVLSIPEMKSSAPEALAKSKILGVSPSVAPTRADYLRRQHHVIQTVERLRTAYDLVVIDPSSVLCRNGECRAEAGGSPLYRDAHHLSPGGANQLRPLLASAFNER